MKEEDLFQWLFITYFDDLVMARKKLSRWDCYSPKHKARIELKCRNKHYLAGMLIQKDKWESLTKKAAEHNDIPLYINSTPEGIFSWQLDVIDEPKWFTKKMPKTTEFRNKTFIDKEVGLLPLEQAVQIGSKQNSDGDS
jgi:hypothetical protein